MLSKYPFSLSKFSKKVYFMRYKLLSPDMWLLIISISFSEFTNEVHTSTSLCLIYMNVLNPLLCLQSMKLLAVHQF